MSALVFKYELDGRVVMLEGHISVRHGCEIMIQYDTKLDGELVGKTKVRRIKSSEEEADFRMKTAAHMFAYLKKICKEEAKKKTKSVSFANDKLVQDFVGETRNLFFSSVFGEFSEGRLEGDKYSVPLDTKLVRRS